MGDTNSHRMPPKTGDPSIPAIDRDAMAEAGVAAFFDIVREWGLNNDDARRLLGNPGRSRFFELRRLQAASCHRLSDDELDRLAYITGIYAGLNVLYSADSHPEWLRNESHLPAEAMYRPWGMGSPLQYLLTGKLKALADVYEFINTERGGV